VTHDQIVAEIQARADTRGIFSHYCRRSVRCAGTPGMPDLLLVGREAVAWLEVKTAGDQLKPDQTRWMYRLRAVGQVHEVIHAADLNPGGAVDQMLDFITTGEAA